jgi:polysaccharide biosynthesis protein PslG
MVSKRFRMISVFTSFMAILISLVVLHHDTQVAAMQSPSDQGVTQPPLKHRHPVVFGIADPHLATLSARMQKAQMRAMRAIGITSIRFDANWEFIQPDGPQAFEWEILDREVHSARSAGLSVDLVIDGCPPWAALASARNDPSPQPASAAQYGAWAGDVAARYAPDGVNMFEIWNEPNMGVSWQPSANPKAYTADLIASYRSIRAVDPSAFVISGGLAPSGTSRTNYSPSAFLKAMYADGAKGYFNAVGDHPYSYPAMPDTFEPWSAWSQMAETDPSIRDVMDSNGDSKIPIWITEFGAPTQGRHGMGQAGQAKEFAQAIAIAKAENWIGAFYMYTWMDTGTDPSFGEDWYGLVNVKGVPKLAYKAVAAAIK